MKFILGTKECMTQVFDEEGRARAATVLRVQPAKVTQVKNAEKDGYDAVQIASGEQKESRVSKALRGHLKGAYREVREFRPRANRKESLEGIEPGSDVTVGVFEPGDKVAVSSVSKGKGFQGVVKRHNFAGGRGSHGQKHSLREGGSIGATGPARVFKGTRMPGRMGSDRTTVKNLRVLQVNTEENLLILSGAVPGRRGTVVEVRSV